MIRNLVKWIIPASAVLLILACAQSPLGVFESIQLERQIVDDRDLDNELVVGSIDKADSKYFIAAATVWYRPTTDVDYPNDVAQWTALGSPGASNFTSSSLVAFTGTAEERVYSVFTSQDATQAGLYAIDPAGDLGTIPDTAKVFGTGETGVAGLGRVFTANDGADQLLVTVRLTGTSSYTVYVSPSGASDSFVEVAGTGGVLPVIDVASTSTGEVVFLTRKAILIDADGLNNGADAAAVPASPVTGGRQPEFGGVFYDSGTATLWVTDNEGYLYRSSDLGATWASNESAHQVSATNDSALSFTDMTGVNQNGTPLLVVGTEGAGYRELTPEFIPVTPDPSGSNYEASDLAQATVLTFFVDPGVTSFVPADTGNNFESKTGDLLFAGTSNLGLWRALIDDAEPQWIRE